MPIVPAKNGLIRRMIQAEMNYSGREEIIEVPTEADLPSGEKLKDGQAVFILDIDMMVFYDKPTNTWKANNMDGGGF